MIKRPAFQFYPGDWLRSTDLRSCSLEARGLWADMLCLMHEGLPYGYLKVKDKVILPANLARMVGTTLENIEGLLKELEESGVFSRDESGCIYSRRMKRDEEVRNKRAAGGIKGGNPALMKVKERLTLDKTLGITPASAIASASANNKKEKIIKKKKVHDPIFKTQALEVLKFLNLKTNRQYREVDTNLDPIAIRLESGVSVSDCRAIIAKKCREWRDDPKMEMYLRPLTLFNKSKFEQYLGELLPEEKPDAQ